MFIELDLRSDLTTMLRRDLELRGDTSCGDLDLHKLFLRWSNYKERRLPVQPWTLELSSELRSRELSDGIRLGLDQVLEKAKQGVDLNPHLSKRIHNMDMFDHLQLDWGIIHLHLGLDIAEDGMVSRTKELLYVFPKDRVLYCVDVLGHHDFANTELLEIMDRNWPTLVPKLNGVSPDASITEEQIKTLRKKGVNYSPSLANGSVVFSPGGGFVAGGFSIHHVMGAQHLELRLKDAERAIKSNAAKVRRSIRLRTGNEPKKAKLSTIQLTPNAIIMREVYSGLNFSFNC